MFIVYAYLIARIVKNNFDNVSDFKMYICFDGVDARFSYVA